MYSALMIVLSPRSKPSNLCSWNSVGK